ncbi:glycerophosphodiester phosphodiesterase family protein [Pareuzebyella sediminis]|uniref:glycerophosphodiester phosphodiesterase family protein n=1 Tax=Pareuzebyella sediminis TaxID=2607998 RepID=UPI0018E11379|nr:glycerophosphodiester phosphodiesterase family protein [Pareuzebyella sediminis]
MRLIRIWVIVAFVVVQACKSTQRSPALSETLSEFQNPDDGIVLVAAHRGAHHGNFENSIAATQKGIDIGVDIIEADVRTTKDGKLILMHDSSIDRTTTGSGKVEEMNLADIRKYHLKNQKGEISTETIPTFEEFLKVAKGKIMIDIDMKTDNVKGIVAALKKTGTMDQVFYFDNDYEQLDRVKQFHPKAKIMPRAYSFQMADSAITRFSPPVVHIDDEFYTKELTDFLVRHDARIWINTLGDLDEEIRRGNGQKVLGVVLQHDANIIQTDEPEQLLALLKENGYRNSK